jgi:D-alanyl-D-alanine dipeptidase
VDPSIIQEIRYHSDHNFVGRRIDGYPEGRCLLTQQAAEALKRVQAAATQKGYSLKVYDCFRPLRAGEDFKRWAKIPSDQAMKAEFFPDLTKEAVFSDGYVAGGRSAHSRGSTIDLTLVALPAPVQRPFVKGEPLTPCTAPAGQRFPDTSVDMGTGYDCFDSRSHTLDSRVTGPARQNRLLLRQLMSAGGFINNSNEWWHYRLQNEPHPSSYFDFPVARAALRGPGG